MLGSASSGDCGRASGGLSDIELYYLYGVGGGLEVLLHDFRVCLRMGKYINNLAGGSGYYSIGFGMECNRLTKNKVTLIVPQ